MVELVSFLITSGFAVSIFIFCRILGMFIAGPVFSSSRLPARYRVAAALLLALAPVSNPKFLFNPPLKEAVSIFVTAIFSELFLGLLIGVVTSLFLESYRLTGAMLDVASRTSMNTGAEALGDDNESLITRIALVLSLLVFLLADLHHLLIKAVFSSFTIFNPGTAINVFSGGGGGSLLIQATGTIFSTALLFALPPLFFLFVFQIFLNVITFSSPSLNEALSGGGSRSILAVGVSLVALFFASMYVVPLVEGSLVYLGINGV